MALATVLIGAALWALYAGTSPVFNPDVNLP